MKQLKLKPKNQLKQQQNMQLNKKHIFKKWKDLKKSVNKKKKD
jgi:hypothetical protein